jgi:hypothetical protein
LMSHHFVAAEAVTLDTTMIASARNAFFMLANL